MDTGLNGIHKATMKTTKATLMAFYNSPDGMLSVEDIKRELLLLRNHLEMTLPAGTIAEYLTKDFKNQQVKIEITSPCSKNELLRHLGNSLRTVHIRGTIDFKNDTNN